MSNLYNLTKTLHTLVQEKAKKHGLELEIESDTVIFMTDILNNRTGTCIAETISDDWQFKIQADQIRQILWVFRDVLGTNPKHEYYSQEFEAFKERQLEEGDDFDTKNAICLGRYRVKKNFTPKSQAEALCQKWLGGLQPLINSEPETVLTELINIPRLLPLRGYYYFNWYFS